MSARAARRGFAAFPQSGTGDIDTKSGPLIWSPLAILLPKR